VDYNFEWDLTKAKKNLQKHGVKFETAATVFRDPKAITIVDAEHSDREERWLTLGIDNTGKLLVVVHTFESISQNHMLIRIISSRKADQKETTSYQEG
jgi:uncharacterized DUF497 family protein